MNTGGVNPSTNLEKSNITHIERYVLSISKLNKAKDQDNHPPGRNQGGFSGWKHSHKSPIGAKKAERQQMEGR